MSGPLASGTVRPQNLVEEIHRKRKQEHEQARMNRQRTRRTRAAVVTLAGAVVLGGATGAKRAVDSHRMEAALASARTPLAASSSAGLEMALRYLEPNLAIESRHPATLGRLALVRTHQHVRGLIPAEAAEIAAERARAAGRAEGRLCEGVLAALRGDLDQARQAYEAMEGEQDLLVLADAAWLQGLVALGHPYEVALEDAARDRLTALAEQIEWAPNLRMLARLSAQHTDLDRALALTARARELAPEDVGLSVDEAYFKAIKAESLPGVLDLVGAIEGSVLGASDQARLRLAHGLALLHQGELEQGAAKLEAAWDMLPPPANDGRVHVLEGLLSYGQVDRVDALRADVDLGTQADDLFNAWTKLARGESRHALELLQKLPQDLPRVAHLQALALTEERRYEEAQRWIDYALKRMPDRSDLQVASARVAVARGESVEPALAALETLAEQHAWTYRVWTGVAEARLRRPHPNRAQTDHALEALRRALTREVAPAQAAHLLGQHHAARMFDDPEAAGLALENLRRAAETAPRSAIYRASYGAFLGQLARSREAKALLLELVDETQLGPTPLVELARVATTDAWLRDTPVDTRVPLWLDTAAQRGADPSRLELEWARYELALRTTEAWRQCRRRLEAVLAADPRNIDVRALHGAALLALGEVRAAKVSLQDGIRRTLRALDGRLYVMLARAELAARKRRRAASLAYKGWRKMVREPLVVGELLDTAPFVAQLWTSLGQPKAAATVGRGLTFRAPVSPRAWVLRGEIELAGNALGAACRSADQAVQLDQALASAWVLRGDCLLEMGKASAAAESFETAVMLVQGNAEEAATLEKLRLAQRRARRQR